ncbi:MAG: response regulator transcription factor [Acidimicrobiaceae bacterium]|nr:response regulator transcription factor [Acidimicrobiaceae bacterium]MYF43251.1 response regulator transcription factor [Acidimicrobiaceae bacterium]MYJ35598.1 response regulator transcription factor [Acidimicrobiaceae bacterium]
MCAVADVLLVTDADWIAEQCEAALSGDHRLHRVRQGADTLEAIELVEPHLVLLDLQVGNMGGMAACLAVRQEEDMGRLEPRPVIMLLDRDADEFLARRSEADAWLVKPINPMALARLVASTLADATAPA